MAEYEMKQRSRQSRAITNNELGSKHFRGFVDNRKTSYPPIVQFDGPVRNSNMKFSHDLLLRHLYQGGGEIQENDFNSPNAILGWDSMQTFDTIGDTMKNFKIVMKFNNLTPDSVASPINDYTANQLTTSGVDTCTIVVISRDQKSLMAHLDGSKLEDGLKNIKQEIPVSEEKPQIFISVYDDRKHGAKRAIFAKQLIEYYYPSTPIPNIEEDEGELENKLITGLPPNHNVRILVRSDNEGNNVQHPEIGVYLHNGELHIFGSFSNSLKNEQKISDVDKQRDFDLPLNAPQEEFNSLSQREKALLELASQEQSPSQYQSPLQDLEPVPLQESYPVPRHRASHHYINPFFLKGMLHP